MNPNKEAALEFISRPQPAPHRREWRVYIEGVNCIIDNLNDDEIAEAIFAVCSNIAPVLNTLFHSQKTPLHILRKAFGSMPNYAIHLDSYTYYAAMNPSLPVEELVEHIEAIIKSEWMFCTLDDTHDLRAYEIANLIKQYKPLIQ